MKQALLSSMVRAAAGIGDALCEHPSELKNYDA
jgi:hypothetical protein